LTQSGFVRVSSNRAVIPEARAPQEAIDLLARIVELPGHVFLKDDTSLAVSEYVARQKLHGYRQVTDAHLLALALRHGCRLATLDRGIEAIIPDGYSPVQAIAVIKP
jgi:toxin-antitoxin system PIN domain toxin